MTAPPALPLPADVDLSGMEHMPLFVERLMRSRAWLRAKNDRTTGGPGLGFCLVCLWMRGFVEMPAGSIEDDEDVLAEAAGCDIAYWRKIKDRALAGWRLIDGRWWHAVVAHIAWDLWQARLAHRHEKAINSWRMACKRANDKGVVPPDPPGPFDVWLADTFPATAAYLAAHTPSRAANMDGAAPECVTHNGDCALNISPKRREGKESPPVVPPNGDGGAPARAVQSGLERERKRWFAQELARLKNEFGPMERLMRSNLQRPGVSGDFALVQTFKGAFLVERGTVLAMPTKRRADALKTDHGAWIAAHWPALVIRHATVDELRNFKAEALPR